MGVEVVLCNVFLHSTRTIIPVFLGVAETIVGSILICDMGIVDRFRTLSSVL